MTAETVHGRCEQSRRDKCSSQSRTCGTDRIRLIAIEMKGAFGNEGALRFLPRETRLSRNVSQISHGWRMPDRNRDRRSRALLFWDLDPKRALGISISHPRHRCLSPPGAD